MFKLMAFVCGLNPAIVGETGCFDFTYPQGFDSADSCQVALKDPGIRQGLFNYLVASGEVNFTLDNYRCEEVSEDAKY